MSGAQGKHWEQDKEATVYIGNLDERVTDELVWEIMINAGRVQNVHLPKDRVSQSHQGYGFVAFATEEDAEYAVRIMNQIRIWGKPIRVKKASADKARQEGVGAELFVGNLDPMVDERLLHVTFERFGPLSAFPKIQRDENHLPKGFGFVSFLSFEAADDAIRNMNGQYLMNREISVQYAFKRDGKGARHGDDAERAIAASGKKNNVEAPVQQFPAQFLEAASVPVTPVTNGVPAGFGGYNAMQPPQGYPPQGYPGTYGAPPGFGGGYPPSMPPPGPGFATGYQTHAPR